jgi:TolB-like protein/Tfp pilus assembly protein PilF
MLLRFWLLIGASFKHGYVAGPMPMNSIFSELKRRRVYRVAIAYGICASALIQVGGTILPIFHAPEWSQQVFVALIVAGFPLALVLAWIFDITSEGIQRTPDAHGLRVYSGRQLWIVGLAGTFIAATVLAGYWFWHPWTAAAPSRPADLTAGAIQPKSIAVLPFQNLSSDKANAFFADGVQDQILTNLAKVADLKVISNTSVQQYKAETGVVRNLRQIGGQLGVTYVLEGSVQRAPDRLRVITRLIDARTDSQIWAETYDRDVSDLFAIQSDIAQAIVNQLQAKISPQQKAQIEERPTADIVAFELYLRSKQIIESYLNLEDVRGSLLQALQWLEEATRRDETFLLAYCYAARAHNLLYFYDLDPTPAQVLLAETAVKTALRLRPDSAEAHLAAADYYFRCHRDYDRARQELEIARPGLPNSTPFFILAGYMSRRQNRWAEGEDDFATASKLDPRNPNAYNLLSDTYVLERRFREARESYLRVLAAGPQTPLLLIRGAVIEFAASGDYKPLRDALAHAPPDMDVGGGQTPQRIWLALMDHNYTEAERVLAISPREDFQDVDFTFYYPKAWYEAMIARAKGDQAGASAAFQVVRAILEKRLVVKPEHARTLAVLAQVDAGLGRKDLAMREAQHAAELMPISKDAYDGALVLEGLVQVYTWTNQPGPALELLQRLVSMPGYISYGYLKMYPIWNPLRGDPRFEALVASMAPKK